MPYSMRIDTERGVVVRKVTGPLSVDEIFAARQDVLKHPEFRPGMNALWDLSEASLMNLDMDEVRAVVGRAQQEGDAYGTDYRAAVVVPKDIDYGITRQFEAVATNVPFVVMAFRSVEEALQWLKPEQD
jgi:hypothetical protein